VDPDWMFIRGNVIGWTQWLTPVIPANHKVGIGGLWFEASPCKKWLRPHFNQRAGHAGTHL
jgi:hypothetical protein